MGNVTDILRQIVLDCVEADEFYVIGDRVFIFEDSNLNPWSELLAGEVTFKQKRLGDADGGDEISDDVRDLIRHQNIEVVTPFYRFTNFDEISHHIAASNTHAEEDPHKAYFEMLNKVGSRYKGAVEHLHEVLERVGSLDDSALSLYSDEYRNAVREFNESHEAFKSLATHVAQLEFTK